MLIYINNFNINIKNDLYNPFPKTKRNKTTKMFI